MLKRDGQGRVSINCNAEPNSAKMLMKTIASVNQLSNYRAVLTWYLERESEEDNVSPNTDLNLSRELVTKLTRHETSDLFDKASSDRPLSIHDQHFS